MDEQKTRGSAWSTPKPYPNDEVVDSLVIWLDGPEGRKHYKLDMIADGNVRWDRDWTPPEPEQ